MKFFTFINYLCLGSFITMFISIFHLPEIMNNRDLIYNELSNYINYEHDNLVAKEKHSTISKPQEVSFKKNLFKCNETCAENCVMRNLNSEQAKEKCFTICGCENSKIVF